MRIFLAVLLVVALLLLSVAPILYGVAGVLIQDPAAPESPPLRWSRPLANGLVISLGTGAVAVAAASCFVAAISFAPRSVRAAAWSLALLGFFIPPYVYATAWLEFAGPAGPLRGWGGSAGALNSNAGVIWVYGLWCFPLAALIIDAFARTIDPRIFDSARVFAGKWSRLTRVTLRLLAPAAAVAALVAALIAWLGFAVPSLYQVPVFSAEIHTDFSAFRDSRAAYAHASVLVLVGTVLVALMLFVARGNSFALAGTRGRVRDASPRRLHLLLSSVALFAITGVSTLLPILTLVRGARGPAAVAEAWSTARAELAASLFLAGASATLILILGFGLAFAFRSRAPIALAVTLPFLVSGPAFAICLIAMWNHADARAAIYDGPGILVLAETARYLFVGYFVSLAALRSASPELEDAARAAGANWVRRLTRVVLPQCAPWLAAGWLVAFVLTFGDADAVVLLAPPGITPLPSRIYGLMHYGPSATVAGLSLIVACVCALFALPFLRVFLRLTR